uniref:Uncharacterized protein n=1 Tax=Echeneis naucrates TaxID=173247 RepID=A0A665U261_ECHNA
MTQDTWDHSRGSTKSHTALFTDLRKSPLKNSGNGDNTQGCNVSPAPLQSQIDTAIKTVEGMEIQLDQEAEGKEVGKLLGDNQSMAPSEKIVEMEIETAAIHEIEETKSGTIRDAEHKDAAAVIVQATRKEKPNSKVGEESCSELQNLKPDECETQDNVAVSRSDSSTSPTLETSPLSKKRNCVSPIPSATPQELASGARRKILTSKAKPKEATEATSPVDSQALKKEAYSQSTKLSTSPVTPSVSPNLSRRSLLQPPSEQTSPVERRSPLLSRRKAAPETQAPMVCCNFLISFTLTH